MTSLGAARIDIIVDTDQLQAQLARSKQLMGEFSQESQAAYNNSNSAQKAAATRLDRYVQLIGKSTDEVKLLRAAWAGVDDTIIIEAANKMRVLREETEAAARASQKAAQDKSFLKMLQDKAKYAGLTRIEILKLQAAEQGLTKEAAPMIAKLEALDDGVTQGSKGWNEYGRSTKEVQLAMRQMPAQLTDVAVSLAGGQNPLMVLLQQGGQVRDMFGGIRPAIAAFGQSIIGLINPLTIAATLLVTVGTAAYMGAQESNRFAQALAKVGDGTSATVADLEAMSRAIADGSSTQQQAARALAEVAESGKIAAENYQLVAEAAIALERETGQAVSTTIDKFAELAKDPVDAVAKLNEAEHFLTAAVYDQIEALVEEGNEREAARVAMEAYAESVKSRMQEVGENVGWLQRRWRELQAGALAAWDAMMGIGRDASLDQQIVNAGLAVAEAKQERSSSIYGSIIDHDARVAEAEKTLRALLDKQRENRRKQIAEANAQEANDAVIANDRRLDQHRSESARVASEIQRINREYTDQKRKALDAPNSFELITRLEEQRQAENAALQKKFTEARERETRDPDEAKKRRAGRSAEAAARRAAREAEQLAKAEQRARIDAIKSAAEVEQNTIENTTKLLEANYSARNISSETYYKRQRELLDQETASKEKAIQDQIDVLVNSNATGKDAVDVTRKIKDLEAELAKVRSDAAVDAELLRIKEEQLARERRRAMRDLQANIDAEVQGVRDAYTAEAQRLTMSQKQYEITMALAGASAQYAARLADIRAQAEDQNWTAERTNEAISMVREGYQRTVDEIYSGIDAVDAAQRDWLSGLKAGIQDYMDNANNVAEQARSLMSSTINNLSDGIIAAMNGIEDGWKGMLKSMLMELQRFLVQQAVARLFGMFFGGPTAGPGVTTINTGANYGNVAANGAYFDGGRYQFANGGTFTNQIVDVPTLFSFAKGTKLGEMGEAGPEAIMPLGRDSQGRLGVRMVAGGGSQVAVGVTVNIANGKADGSVETRGDGASNYRQFGEQLRGMVQTEINKAMRPGGQLWHAGVRG